MDPQAKKRVDRFWRGMGDTGFSPETKSKVTEDWAEAEIEDLAKKELQDYLKQKAKEDQGARLSAALSKMI
jgi:hypothetical protein